MEDNLPVVIDSGSGMVKAGFAGDTEPRMVFRAIVGHLRENPFPAEPFSMTRKSWFVGEQAFYNPDVVLAKSPYGVDGALNWDELEKIWHHCFYERLFIPPELHPVLLTESPLTSKATREKTTQTLFESFGVSAMNVANEAVLSLLASGRNTGVVVDSGDGRTHVTPIYNGTVVSTAACDLSLGGSHLTLHLGKRLAQRNGDESIVGWRNEPHVTSVKESLCFVAQDLNEEKRQSSRPASTSSSDDTVFQLADGRQIRVGSERFECPEAMFVPAMMDLQVPGVHEAAFDSVMKCAEVMRPELFGNVVMSGGNSMLSGFGERMKKEMTTLCSSSPLAPVKVVSRLERKHFAWQGASLLAASSAFIERCVTKQDYDEVGAVIIHRKCL